MTPQQLNALKQYSKVGTNTQVAAANAHRLVQMLMEGALDKIAIAKGHMQRGNIAEKGRHISWAISIINGLSASLDMEKGGEISERLSALYEYMVIQLLAANVENKVEYLDEVAKLVLEIKAGWDGIPEEFRK